MKFETIVNKQYSKRRLKIHIIDPKIPTFYTGYVVNSYIYTSDEIKRVGIKPFVGLNVEESNHDGLLESSKIKGIEDCLPTGYDIIVEEKGPFNRIVTAGFKTHKKQALTLIKRFSKEAWEGKIPESFKQYLKLAEEL